MVPIGHQNPARAHETPPRLPASGGENGADCSHPRLLAAPGVQSSIVQRVFVANSCAFHAVTRDSTWGGMAHLIGGKRYPLSKSEVVCDLMWFDGKSNGIIGNQRGVSG